MSYAATCILIANVVCIPIMGVLLWQMGWRNLLKWLLIIPAIALTDLDHFLFTNVPGFRAHPAPGEKIFHFAHTIEFVILEIVFFLWFFLRHDPRRGRTIKAWFFPFPTDYHNSFQYYLSWTVRIILWGAIMHFIIDLIVYSYFNKWEILYYSLFEYFGFFN